MPPGSTTDDDPLWAKTGATFQASNSAATKAVLRDIVSLDSDFAASWQSGTASSVNSLLHLYRNHPQAKAHACVVDLWFPMSVAAKSPHSGPPPHRHIAPGTFL
jgi:hypothetical protein